MPMPNFLIIGARKCGTTSVHAYLSQHPQIFMSARKELHFFEYGEPSKDRLEFPTRRNTIQTLPAFAACFEGSAGAKAIGEASPSNFYPRACMRIQRYLPDARFICILRQPVERQYSDFLMRRRHGTERSADFVEALQRARRRGSPSRTNLSVYEGADWYLERLQDWFRRFDRNRIHIGLFDDLKADPVAFMRQIYTFLDVDPEFVPNTSRIYNQSFTARHPHIPGLPPHDSWIRQIARYVVPETLRRFLIQYWHEQTPPIMPPPLAPYLRQELTAAQHDDILRLQDLLDQDLSCWLKD